MERPFNLICPITQALMHDPVILPDGNSYEYESISGYVLSKQRELGCRSYLVQCPMNPGHCVGDKKKWIRQHNLRSVIEGFVQANPLDELSLEYTRVVTSKKAQEAQVLYERGEIDKAAILGHPAAMEAKRVMDLCEDSKQRVAEARQLHAREPSNSVAYRRLLKCALKSNADNDEAIMMLAISYKNARQMEEALECFMQTSLAKRVALNLP